ncbi:MAG: hypothetical protein ACLFVT_07025 [Syntrophobacteria bacterium]
MWSDILSSLKAMDFQRLNEILGHLDTVTLLKHPVVIVCMIVICAVLVIRGMERAFVTFVSIPVFLVLFQKTVQGQDPLEFSPEKLVLFVGGFLAIAAVNVYFHFVRK